MILDGAHDAPVGQDFPFVNNGKARIAAAAGIVVEYHTQLRLGAATTIAPTRSPPASRTIVADCGWSDEYSAARQQRRRRWL